MTSPDSWTARLRHYLSRKLEPRPPAGKAWCLDCPLNRRRTLVLRRDEAPGHVSDHAAAGFASQIALITGRIPA
jgi:hypothetical protein